MTEEQTMWLKTHPDHEPVGVAGGHAYFDEQKTLFEDGHVEAGHHAWGPSHAGGLPSPIIVGIKRLR